MERLTFRDNTGNARLLGVSYGDGHGLFASDKDVLDRLAAYEDAEEQGLLMRLPCKVDDTFFWIERLLGDPNPFIRSDQVSEIGISDAITIYGYDGRDFAIEDVYFTREEAEAALAKEV